MGNVPSKCPTEASPSCFPGSGQNYVNTLEQQVEATAEADDSDNHNNSEGTPGNEGLQNISPSNGPWSVDLLRKAGKLKISDEDPDLRRSCHTKAKHKGFKGK